MFDRQRRMLWVSTGAAAMVALAAPRRLLACEFMAPNLRVNHPWTRATAPGATHAVVCMRIDDIVEPDRLVAVRSPIADGCEMGGDAAGRPVDIALAAGDVLEMHEGGVHLRLTGLKQPLQTGREYPLQIEFERAGLVLARLSVDFEVDFGARRFGL